MSATAPQVLSAAAPHDPLRALFDAARAGDAAALGALCAHMRPRLYRTAWAVLHDADEADDVAQDSLVRALTRRFLFLGKGTVAGWMTRIALNLAKNRLRDAKRRRQILDGASPADRSARGAEPSATVDAHRVAAEGQARARLAQAVATLPERQREVVELHVGAGLDWSEVAETLGISEANARMTYSNAKKKLLATLGATDTEEP
ncbi:MAG: RNA polymerase sigma factor [Deltaproteobacteria bacterium]|nr:RNA polymerase sigma factor [Deltaproteobacteria bacterium]